VSRDIVGLVAVRGLVFVVAVTGCGFRIEAVPDGSIGDAAIDGADIDAMVPGFDPGRDCPGSYPLSIPATVTTSRYRVILATALYWPHEQACLADRPGSTHLASPDSMTELLGLELAVSGNVGARFYIGGIQSPSALTPTADWITFGGADLLQTAWHVPETEPDDGGDQIENQGQQILILDPALDYLHDATGITAYGAICECDGLPVAPKARMYVDTDPNNPN
jgi:hypothetical protein